MKTVTFSTLILIYVLNGCISKEIGSKAVSECFWCGPLADQVNKSQRPSPCEEDTFGTTTCDSSEQYCAIVATAPPYVESRICVKIYQDECYPLYCNTTRSWKMTCPCQGDLCNGIKTEREEDAFGGLIKLASRMPKRDKRDLNSVPQEGEVNASTDENKIKIDEKRVMEDATNKNRKQKEDTKSIDSNVDSEVVVAAAKIINMADDNNMNTAMKVTPATVTPNTLQEENKQEISEATPTVKTVPAETLNVEKKIVNEMVTESKDEHKLVPTTQIENIQKDTLPQKTDNMPKDSVKPQTENKQKDVMPHKIDDMKKDDTPQKPENMANDAIAPKTENMQNDSPLPQTESMQNDAALEKTENMQKDAAPSKNDNIPKDSQPTNLGHEKAEKSSTKETNPLDNNLEKPPVTPYKDNKKHDEPLTSTASNLDKSPNSTAPHRVHNNESAKHHKSHSTRLQSQYPVILLLVLGSYIYFV